VRLTEGEKGAYKIPSGGKLSCCEVCESMHSPIIVPPTFFKDLSKVFLNRVWWEAERHLLKANHIIFCGYSFPDADINIKYLLKRAEVNRDIGIGPLKVTVINDHPKKEDAERNLERDRFERFFGCDVDYTRKSFSDFASNPLSAMHM
jgi:hypothetical protein